MNRRFLNYYERELRHVREMGAEFAAEHPKIAGRLGIEQFECADPYVERLLEAQAFLAARVQFKLDAEFPRFTQHLLETVYPDYLSPTPSIAIVQFLPRPDEGALAEGVRLPRQTVLRSLLGKGEQTACEYRTAHDVTLWPLQLVEAQYHTQDLQSLGLPQTPVLAKAAVRLRLRCTLPGVNVAALPIDALQVYLRGAASEPLHLYEQLIGQPVGVVVRPAAKPHINGELIAPGNVRRVGFEDHQAILPPSPRTFEGYRLLREYFAFPERFLFVEIAGLRDSLRRCNQPEIDLLVLVSQLNLKMENAVAAENFALFCSPVVNLFPKRADRIHLTDRFSEHHVVPDRTRPLDFEVYEIDSVTGYGVGQENETAFKPFYAAHDFDPDTASGAYFATTCIARARSARERQQGPRSQYAGSELYLSLVDSRNAPYSADLRQLAVTTLCTNRDLPLQMPLNTGKTDFNIDGGPPVQSARVLSGPTSPKPSYAEGEFAWRIISHLSLNYLSLMDNEGGAGAAALRDLLKLYIELGTDPTQRSATDAYLRQVDALLSVAVKPAVRRAPSPGPLALVRGLEVAVTFDENAFGGAGVFVLGAVLEWFFARYVSLNSFTETVVKTLDREEIMRWTARMGRKPIL
ncbi:MAG TPA: type VI secretion system baseplate subunit TssF [Tepidisphaeraceae bacterium]